MVRLHTLQVLREAPCPRADTSIEYDAKGSKLLVFGGWANEWFNDIRTLDVAHVVGPPYAIMDIYPNLGAITGGTQVGRDRACVTPTACYRLRSTTEPLIKDLGS